MRKHGPGGHFARGRGAAPLQGRRRGCGSPEMPQSSSWGCGRPTAAGADGATLAQPRRSAAQDAPRQMQHRCYAAGIPSSANSQQPRRDCSSGLPPKGATPQGAAWGEQSPSEPARLDGCGVRGSGKREPPHIPQPAPLAPSAEQHGGAARAVGTQQGRPWPRPWKALRSALPEQLCEKRPSYFPCALPPLPRLGFAGEQIPAARPGPA